MTREQTPLISSLVPRLSPRPDENRKGGGEPGIFLVGNQTVNHKLVQKVVDVWTIDHKHVSPGVCLIWAAVILGDSL